MYLERDPIDNKPIIISNGSMPYVCKKVTCYIYAEIWTGVNELNVTNNRIVFLKHFTIYLRTPPMHNITRMLHNYGVLTMLLHCCDVIILQTCHNDRLIGIEQYRCNHCITWSLIAWYYSCQPLRSHVGKSSLPANQKPCFWRAMPAPVSFQFCSKLSCILWGMIM